MVGAGAHYDILPFAVTASGSYSFLLHGITPTNWDTFLGLYAGSFAAATPLTYNLVYNDDFPSIGLSGFSHVLTLGTSYFAVITGFTNSDVGAWTLYRRPWHRREDRGSAWRRARARQLGANAYGLRRDRRRDA